MELKDFKQHISSFPNGTQFNFGITKHFKHHEWWQFWKRKFTYKGKNEFSERWLNER